MIWNTFGKLFAGPEIWANATYRKVMVMLYTLVFGYLGVLWMLSCIGGPGSITMTMWFFIAVFTVIYWQPRLGGLGALIEWFNKKDDPAKKSTWRLYLLVLLSSIVAGTLAIILREIGAGVQFPLDILALVTLVVICLLLPSQSRLDVWLPRIGAVVVLLAIISTIIVLPMGKWSEGIYNKTGYSLSTGPNKSEVAARKAIAENERLADKATEQCILNWKNKHMGGTKIVREAEINAAVLNCQQQFAPTPSSTSQEEMVGVGATEKKFGKASYFSYNYWHDKTLQWSKEWGWPVWIVAIIVVATILLHFIPFIWGIVWGKNKLSAAKTVVVEKKEYVFPVRPMAVILYLGIIWVLVSWYNGGWVTDENDVSHLGNKISNVFQKSESTQVNEYPNAFLTPKEIRTWQAVGMLPAYHPNLGEIAGRSFEIITGRRNGARSNIVDRLDGGYGLPLIIMMDKSNPNRDVVIENTNCNPPKVYSDNNIHTVCVSTWRSGDRSVGGNAELDYSSERRIAVLHERTADRGHGIITFVFQPN